MVKLKELVCYPVGLWRSVSLATQKSQSTCGGTELWTMTLAGAEYDAFSNHQPWVQVTK